MSITARPGATITAADGLVLKDAPQGLIGTLTLAIRKTVTEEVVSAAAVTGIDETAHVDGTSNYSGTRIAPLDPTFAYEVVWVHGAVETTEDLHVSGSLALDGIRPTVAEVAAVIRTRTVGSVSAGLGGDTGLEAATFDANTRPTAAEVEVLIDRALRAVRRDLGSFDKFDTDEIEEIRDLVALRAAFYVELFLYPEASEESYPLLKRLYDEGLRALKRASGRSGSVELVSPWSGDEELLA